MQHTSLCVDLCGERARGHRKGNVRRGGRPETCDLQAHRQLVQREGSHRPDAVPGSWVLTSGEICSEVENPEVCDAGDRLSVTAGPPRVCVIASTVLSWSCVVLLATVALTWVCPDRFDRRRGRVSKRRRPGVFAVDICNQTTAKIRRNCFEGKRAKNAGNRTPADDHA